MNLFSMVMGNTISSNDLKGISRASVVLKVKINSGKILMNQQAKPPPLFAIGGAMPQARVHYCLDSPLIQIAFHFKVPI